MLEEMMLATAISTLTQHFVESNDGQQPNENDKALIRILAKQRLASGEPLIPVSEEEQ